MQKMVKHRKEKKLNKVKVGITIFLIVLVITIAVFGRYIYNNAREAYFTAKQFFFTSDLLTLDNQTYTYENWGGIDVYEINVDLYSYANTLLRLDYDLNYEISCEALQPTKIKCGINSADGPTKTNGIIYATTNVSKVTIFVTPLTQINKGEVVTVAIRASTQEPYKKEISCEVSLKVQEVTENTYEIEDVVNRNYAVLKLVNAQDTALQYTLTFDPRELRLDLNDEIYVNKISAETTTISGNEYVNKIVFNMDAEAAKNIKFYKVDMSQDYTYPSGETSPAIDVAT